MYKKEGWCMDLFFCRSRLTRWSLATGGMVGLATVGSFCDGNGSTTDLFETEDSQCQQQKRHNIIHNSIFCYS